jgi:peptidoglycan/LPS O-acetylase OafA/YrhL
MKDPGLVVALAGSLLLAHALNRCVQAPVERWRTRLKQTQSGRGPRCATT